MKENNLSFPVLGERFLGQLWRLLASLLEELVWCLIASQNAVASEPLWFILTLRISVRFILCIYLCPVCRIFIMLLCFPWFSAVSFAQDLQINKFCISGSDVFFWASSSSPLLHLMTDHFCWPFNWFEIIPCVRFCDIFSCDCDCVSCKAAVCSWTVHLSSVDYKTFQNTFKLFVHFHTGHYSKFVLLFLQINEFLWI